MSETTFKITVLGRNDSKESFYLKHFVDMIYPTFRGLNDKLSARLDSIAAGQKIKIFWIDEDGDEISLASDEDLRIFVDNPVNALAPGKPLKLFVRTAEPLTVRFNIPEQTASDEKTQQQPQAKVTDQPRHENIVCDGCDGPVHAYRYKCLQCPDYDLCVTCESELKHSDHLMVRIPAAPKEPLPQKMDRVLNLGNIMSVAEEQIKKCSRDSDKWRRVQEKYEEKCKRRVEKHREKCERQEEKCKRKDERAEEKCHRGGSGRHHHRPSSASTTGPGCQRQNSFLYQAMDFLNYMMNPDNIMEHMPRDQWPASGETNEPTPAAENLSATTTTTPASPEKPKLEKAKEAKEVREKNANQPDTAQEAKERSNVEAEQASIGLENICQPIIANAVPLGVEANGIVTSVGPVKEVAPAEAVKQVEEKSLEQQLAEKLDQMEKKLEAEKKDRSTSPTISFASSEESLSVKDNEKEWTVLDREDDDDAEGATALNTGAIPKEPKQDKATSTDSESSSTTGSFKSAKPAPEKKTPPPEQTTPTAAPPTTIPMSFESLGRDLRAHIQQAAAQAQNIPQMFLPPGQYPHQTAAAPPVPPRVHHPKPHINHAVEAMIGMGFSNEGGWLTSLLESVDGQIPRALDLLQPHK